MFLVVQEGKVLCRVFTAFRSEFSCQCLEVCITAEF